MKKKFKSVKSVLFYSFLVLGAVLVLGLTSAKIQGKTPSILGYQVMYVATGSMEPKIHTGDVILAKEYKAKDNIEVGDIVTYIGEMDSFANRSITHQVVDIYQDVNGDTKLITKGLANAAADPEIGIDQVVSIYRCRLPICTLIYKGISNPIGFAAIIVLPTGWILVTQIIDIVKEAKKDDEKDEESTKK